MKSSSIFFLIIALLIFESKVSNCKDLLLFGLALKMGRFALGLDNQNNDNLQPYISLMNQNRSGILTVGFI